MSSSSDLYSEDGVYHNIFRNPDYQSIVVFLEEFREEISDYVSTLRAHTEDPFEERTNIPFVYPYTCDNLNSLSTFSTPPSVHLSAPTGRGAGISSFDPTSFALSILLGKPVPVANDTSVNKSLLNKASKLSPFYADPLRTCGKLSTLPDTDISPSSAPNSTLPWRLPAANGPYERGARRIVAGVSYPLLPDTSRPNIHHMYPPDSIEAITARLVTDLLWVVLPRAEPTLQTWQSVLRSFLDGLKDDIAHPSMLEGMLTLTPALIPPTSTSSSSCNSSNSSSPVDPSRLPVPGPATNDIHRYNPLRGSVFERERDGKPLVVDWRALLMRFVREGRVELHAEKEIVRVDEEASHCSSSSNGDLEKGGRNGRTHNDDNNNNSLLTPTSPSSSSTAFSSSLALVSIPLPARASTPTEEPEHPFGTVVTTKTFQPITDPDFSLLTPEMQKISRFLAATSEDTLCAMFPPGTVEVELEMPFFSLPICSRLRVLRLLCDAVARVVCSERSGERLWGIGGSKNSKVWFWSNVVRGQLHVCLEVHGVRPEFETSEKTPKKGKPDDGKNSGETGSEKVGGKSTKKKGKTPFEVIPKTVIISTESSGKTTSGTVSEKKVSGKGKINGMMAKFLGMTGKKEEKDVKSEKSENQANSGVTDLTDEVASPGGAASTPTAKAATTSVLSDTDIVATSATSSAVDAVDAVGGSTTAGGVVDASYPSTTSLPSSTPADSGPSALETTSIATSTTFHFPIAPPLWLSSLPSTLAVALTRQLYERAYYFLPVCVREEEYSALQAVVASLIEADMTEDERKKLKQEEEMKREEEQKQRAEEEEKESAKKSVYEEDDDDIEVMTLTTGKTNNKKSGKATTSENVEPEVTSQLLEHGVLTGPGISPIRSSSNLSRWSNSGSASLASILASLSTLATKTSEFVDKQRSRAQRSRQRTSWLLSMGDVDCESEYGYGRRYGSLEVAGGRAARRGRNVRKYDEDAYYVSSSSGDDEDDDEDDHEDEERGSSKKKKLWTESSREGRKRGDVSDTRLSGTRRSRRLMSDDDDNNDSEDDNDDDNDNDDNNDELSVNNGSSRRKRRILDESDDEDEDKNDGSDYEVTRRKPYSNKRVAGNANGNGSGSGGGRTGILDKHRATISSLAQAYRNSTNKANSSNDCVGENTNSSSGDKSIYAVAAAAVGSVPSTGGDSPIVLDSDSEE